MAHKEVEVSQAVQIGESEFLQHLLEAEAFWGDKIKTDIDHLQKLYSIRGKYFEALDANLRVKCYLDQKGNFWFDIEPKEQAGFKTK